MPPTVKKQEKHRKGKKPLKNWNVLKSQVKDDVLITEYKDTSLNVMRKNLTSLYPGRKVVDPKLLQKYSKGKGVKVGRIISVMICIL